MISLITLANHYITSILVPSEFLALHVLQLELVVLQLPSLFSTLALFANIKLGSSW